MKKTIKFKIKVVKVPETKINIMYLKSYTISYRSKQKDLQPLEVYIIQHTLMPLSDLEYLL